MGCPKAELSIVLTDDAGIQVLNRDWRGKDRPTDVLSFSQVEGESQPAGRAGPVLGDVVISVDTALAQAARIGHSLDEEMQRLLVHGVLHLLGHDHVRGGPQARRMRREESRLLALLGRSGSSIAGRVAKARRAEVDRKSRLARERG